MTKSICFLALALSAAPYLQAQTTKSQGAMPSVSFSAQRLGVTRPVAPTVLIRDSLAETHPEHSRHLWKYLVTGIVVGGAIGVGAVALSIRNSRSDDGGFIPVGAFIAAAGVAAGLVGGLVGYAAYADPYPNQPAK